MKRAAAMALILCLLLTGCVPLTSELHPIDTQYEMPTPQETVEPALGDAVAPRIVSAALYFPSDDMMELIPQQTWLTVEPGRTLPLCLVEALLEAPASPDARRVAPEGTSVLSVRQSGGTAVVNLSMEARSTDTLRELFIMREAIVSTLCGVEGIEYVDVLIAGRAESPFPLPCGAGWADGMSIPARWSQALSEAEMAADSASDISRLAVIYHPARGSRYIIPEARTVIVEGGDALGAVLRALGGESGLDPALKPVLPDADGTIITGAEIVTLSDGRRVARLTFDGNLSAILERGRLSAWQMYAALTCTLTGFLPEIDGIQVYVGSGQLTRVESPDGEIALEGGVMPRALFERTIGRLETIYMTAADGSLRPLSRAMAQEDALSPRMLLALLFGEPQEWEAGVSRVVPDGLTAGDLLGIRIENGEATLNVSAAFYAGCQRLNSQQERNLIFALVNTLTERPAVRSVRFQVEGEQVDVLVHEISLLGPLLRNPGLISQY